MTTANVEKTTQTTEDLIRESGLEKLASAPVPEVEYEEVNSCDGHRWRRQVSNGQVGAWEDMGPSK